MEKIYQLLWPVLFLLPLSANSQTSWKGTSSTAWGTAANWTNGVPTASVAAIVGDANFTGTYHPTITNAAACKSLTVGGSKASTLTISRNIVVSGTVTINSNGTITHTKSTITVTGDWINGGTYSTTTTSPVVLFGGTAQTIGGSSTTTFRKLTVNAGSTVTLGNNIVVTNSGAQITLKGTLEPGNSPTYQVTGTATLTISATGVLKIKAATFAANYAMSGTVTLNAGSVVEYGSTTVDQTISNTYTYRTLRISGSGNKSLAANLPSLSSSSGTVGNVYVLGGTFNLSTFTANRNSGTAGGTFSVSNGATLKIGGTNGFPANYATVSLGITSTVEYGGVNQTVGAYTYGNMLLNSSSGAAVKTFPATAFTIAGNLTSAQGAGTSVSYTAGAALTISGNVSIGSSTTFNAGSFAHNVKGNITNNGTFTGSTSNLTLSGDGTALSGIGIYNINDLTITGSGTTASATTNLSVAGNFATSGAGTFQHLAGGTTIMSGTTKTISGSGITFDNLTISGSVSNASSIDITGNLSVGGSFTNTAGTISLKGTSKTISGTGTKVFYTLYIPGTITTTVDFSINSSLSVTGSFTASSTSTATFTGTSSLDGTANLYNVTLNGTSLQLSANSVLGIANAFTKTAGVLNVTSATPNTVSFNGTVAQNVNTGTYHHLALSGSGLKTAAGATTINGDLSIASGSTFAAGSYTHILKGNWNNAGTFTAGSSIISVEGTTASSISGTNTFNTLTINKSTASTVVSLLTNTSAGLVNMTNGNISTDANTLTITTNRSGSGIIMGNIQRTHAFVTGTAYEFEGPANSITFTGLSGVTSVTVSVVKGSLSDFPFGGSLNRKYTISVPSGLYTATLRLHYEDDELNGNSESAMALWSYAAAAWANTGKTTNNAATNYVELSGLTNIAKPWTFSDNPNVTRWNGSVSSDWGNAANWTAVQGSPGSIPTNNDIVQLGSATFTNQPTISTAANAKGIVFGSAKTVTLTLAPGGSLTTTGNISGLWSANAAHSIQAGAQNLTVDGDLALSDGTAGHTIDINASSGNIIVGGSLTQSGAANIVFSSNGTLSIGNNYDYTSGTFTPAASTVVYNGTNSQTVAAVPYNDLTINKTTGIASLNTIITVAGNLSVSAGSMNINADATISGNVTIGSGATLSTNTNTISVSGNWSNSGTFIPGSGTTVLNGTGNQTITATPFNNFTINKSSGTASLLGNISINNSLSISAGTLDLDTYTASRGFFGGTMTLANGTTLLVKGAANFPANYSAYTLGNTSTVNYSGTVAQSVSGVHYGHLLFNNGGGNVKTLSSSATVNGDLTINGGAAFNAASYTISLYGNWANNGSFVPATGTVLLHGSGKTITGNTTFNQTTVFGTYSTASSDITFNGLMNITSSGSYSAGTGTTILHSDLINSGSLISNGTTTFSGTVLQTIRLLNAVVSNSAGVVNFNGTVSPVLNSTSTPVFANLNINNTGGVSPSVNWTILNAFTVGSGASFNGGAYTHTFSGTITNSGTITSSGTMNFNPTTSATLNVGSAFSSTGTVILGGPGAIIISGTPAALNDVVIANTNAAGVSPSSNWTVNNNFVVNSNAIFNAGSYSYAIGGDIESNGTLNGGTSTFTMSSATGRLSVSAATNFYHFVITGTIASNSDFRVSGNFTNNGTYDGSIGELIMTGNTDAVIGGTTNPSTIAQLTVNKANGISATLNRNITTVNSLHIITGILNKSTFTITQDVAGGIMAIENSGTLKIGGTDSLPLFNEYDLDTLSTVDYSGTNQVIGTLTTYGNLTLSTAGTKTPATPVKTLNNFSMSAATFVGGNFTHSIGKNWIMTSGTFTNTNTTILFNGTTDQDISSTGSFNNLTINKTSGLVTQSSDNTVNGTLSFTSGKFQLGNFNLTIGTAGSVSGASASNYIIATDNGSLIQQVTAGGNKIFPVGAAADYTPATVALTAGSASDNFAIRLLTTVYLAGTTGTPVTTSVVNRTWMASEGVAGGSNATLTVQWPALLELSGFLRSSSKIVHYTSSAWDVGPAFQAASGTDPYTQTRSGITSFSPFTVTSNLSVLPLDWLSITGKTGGSDNYIYWSVAREFNNSFFAVESSVNGIDFITIGTVKAKNNNNTQEDYSFIDGNVAENITYYRVKQVDIDGKLSYSSIIKINNNSSAKNRVSFQNPVTNTLQLTLQSDKEGVAQISITSVNGKLLHKVSSHIRRGTNLIPVDMTSYTKGFYYLNITFNEEKVTTYKLIKD